MPVLTVTLKSSFKKSNFQFRNQYIIIALYQSIKPCLSMPRCNFGRPLISAALASFVTVAHLLFV